MDPLFLLESCRGVKNGRCPYAIAMPDSFESAVRETLDAAGYGEWIQGAGTPGGRHFALKISISGCANGCSRPHVACAGLIRSCRAVIRPELCSDCGECLAACPEALIRLTPQGPVIEQGECLSCGRCARVCGTGAIEMEPPGFTALAGGGLGRRPRLASRLPGVMSDEQALRFLAKAAAVHLESLARGLKFNQVLFENGEDEGLARVIP